MLSSGFVSAVNSNQDLSSTVKPKSLVWRKQVSRLYRKIKPKAVIDNGGSEDTAETLASTYEDAQLAALQQAMFVVFALSIVSLLLSRSLPAQVPQPA